MVSLWILDGAMVAQAAETVEMSTDKMSFIASPRVKLAGHFERPICKEKADAIVDLANLGKAAIRGKKKKNKVMPVKMGGEHTGLEA